MLKNEAEVKQLYETTDYTLKEISELTNNKFWKVHEWSSIYYTSEERNNRKAKCYSKSKIGDKNPMAGKTKGKHHGYIGDVSDGNGYLMRLKPEWYTGRKGCKHVFTHHIVMCEALGITEIPRGFAVHHVDGNKTNNELNNLALLSLGGHTRLHQLERATTIPKGSRG